MDGHLASVIRLCSSGKKLFLTEEDAWRRLCEVRCLARKDGRQGPTRVYECPECGFWHFTSTPLRVGNHRKSR